MRFWQRVEVVAWDEGWFCFGRGFVKREVSVVEVELRAYGPGDATAFRELNEAWIRAYFGMEEHDHEVLGDPERYVIAPGGHIFMAVLDGAAVGCCALIPGVEGVFKVAKMAVSEEIRGRGIGRKLLAYTIAEARALGAAKLTLATNSSLVNAIHLYEALGFRHLPPQASPYARADVFMEMAL